MMILLDLMVDPEAQAEFSPAELDVSDEPTAEEVIASLRAADTNRVAAALSVGILDADLCKIYVQVLDDDGRVVSRAEW